MRRILVLVAVVALLAVMALPVAAHNITVTNPQTGEPIETHQGSPFDEFGPWVGAGDLPGQGQGLIPGGPGGIFTLSPAHANGLVSACEALDANGRAAVDIRGPGGPGCPHGQ